MLCWFLPHNSANQRSYTWRASPPGRHRGLGWVPCVKEQLLRSSLFYTR